VTRGSFTGPWRIVVTMSNDDPRDEDLPHDADRQSGDDRRPSDDPRPPEGGRGDRRERSDSRDDARSGTDRPGDRARDDYRDERPSKYCVECGASINARAEICPECGVRQPGTSSSDEDPRIVAAVLAIVLGTFGAHKFYLGRTGMGVLYLCFSWTFIPTIVGIIEGAIYLSKSDEEFREQYLE